MSVIAGCPQGEILDCSWSGGCSGGYEPSRDQDFFLLLFPPLFCVFGLFLLAFFWRDFKGSIYWYSHTVCA